MHIYNSTYFSNGFGHCLRNLPRNNHLDLKRQKENKFAGEYFDSSAQCELVFGSGSSTCSYMPSCSRLWCSTPGGEEHGCKTQHMPWADGTPCGDHRWCMRSQCVERGDMGQQRMDGGWGAWQSWSECSRSCGGGIRRSVRECDNPAPSGGGLYCTGDRRRYQSCNTGQCPQPSDFRQEQCEAFNGRVHNITDLPPGVTWAAKYTDLVEGDRCKLYCRVKHSPAYYLLASSVEDGTPCTVDGYDTCVGGQCVQAGCDHILGSSVGLDKCGVCGGDGTSCVLKSGSLNITSYGYNFVVKIPAGASNIDIRQRGWQGLARDDNYIAVRDSETGEYLINGGFILSMYQRHIHYGDVLLDYTGSDVVNERLNCSKPLSRDLIVEVLTVGSLYPPQFSFSYMSTEKQQEFKWKTADRWSHCDRLCKGKS